MSFQEFLLSGGTNNLLFIYNTIFIWFTWNTSFGQSKSQTQSTEFSTIHLAAKDLKIVLLST